MVAGRCGIVSAHEGRTDEGRVGNLCILGNVDVRKR